MTTTETEQQATVDGHGSATAAVLPREDIDFTRQPRVPRNDHGILRPPALGEWTPVLSVSVVVPAHGHP
ncbi:glycosyltransferase family 2 protein, partial [Nocardiopsis sp. NPDC058631]